MTKKEKFKNYFFLHFEWSILALGLLAMALLDPFSTKPTMCFIERMGFEYCPGNGLGKSIAHCFRGNFSASFEAHPAGIAAVLIITGRIITILKNRIFGKDKNGG